MLYLPPTAFTASPNAADGHNISPVSQTPNPTVALDAIGTGPAHEPIHWPSHRSISRVLPLLNTSDTSPVVQTNIISRLDHSTCLLPTLLASILAPLPSRCLGQREPFLTYITSSHSAQQTPAHSSASKPARSPMIATSSLTLLTAFSTLGSPGTHSWSNIILHTPIFPRCVHGVPPLLLQIFYTSDISSLRPSWTNQSHPGGCLPSRLVPPSPAVFPWSSHIISYTIIDSVFTVRIPNFSTTDSLCGSLVVGGGGGGPSCAL